MFILGLLAVMLLASVATGWAVPALPVINTGNVVNITNFGAVSSATLTNTTAIQKAINSAATTNGGCTVEIPPGTYLSGPLTLANNINLQIDAGAILRMLPFTNYPKTFFTNVTVSFTTNLSVITTNYNTNVTWTAANFISASSLHDVEISGSGAIDGQGLPWWPYANTNGDTRPIMIQPGSCNRLLIQNVTLSNSPMFHIAIGGHAGNSTVQGVTILAPSSSANPPSHNTDACDVSGTNILVQNCNISVGDDDFTCGGGTWDVVLTNNTYGNGHGISIGSYTGGGVSNITVINCTMNGADNGIRIKSDNDRGGLVQNISYLNIGMTNVHFPIQIYGYYNEVGTPGSISPYYASTQAVAVVTGTTPIYRNITFSNINATSISGYPVGLVWARRELPATNIVFNRVNVTGDKNFYLYNVSGAQFIDSKITVSATSNTFALYNANVIITNSVPTNTLFTFGGLTTNGYGNSFSLYNARSSLKDTNAFDDGPLFLSASTFIISNNLALFPTTVLNYALDTNVDKLAVAGNLTLGGTINVTNGAGFTSGSYTLLTYTANLSGVLPTIGSAPAGYNYAFDTNTAGLVKLLVTTGVLPILTTNILQSSANPTVYGTAVAFTATVSPVPTNGEMITFMDGATTLGTGALNGGQAVFTTTASQLSVGTHAITAIYPGDGMLGGIAYGASTSDVLTQVVNPAEGTFFNDTFSSSTVNSSTPPPPVASSTSYEVLSGKSWSPTPSAAPGSLVFGIGGTASGVIEVQALFASPAIALVTAGDFIQLSVTFTNTAGILSQAGTWSFGLYNSGGVAPVGGGLNNTLNGTATTAATGGAQNWRGYVAQISNTGGSCGFYDRQPQTGTVNNNQDLVSTGTSSSYQNPAAAVVGNLSTAPSVALAVGGQYTEILTYTLTSSNAIQLQSQLYTGTNNTGTLLSTMTAATGTTPLATAFDALAIGWRATGSTASTITISSITVAGQSTTLTVPPNVVYSLSGPALTLSWPTNYLGWLVQSNSVGLGTTNWSTVPNSGSATNFSITINAAMTNVFYRLVSP